MKCNEARELAAESIGQARQVNAEVAEHLRSCSGCARWVGRATSVDETLAGLQLGEPPEQLAELVAEGIADGLGAADHPERPPAMARPERSGTQKAAIFIGVLIGLLLLTLGLMIGLRGEGEPLPRVADIVRQDGQCEVRTPGASRWRELGRGEFLPPGSQLRTGPNSAMVIDVAGGRFHMPPMTAVSIPEEGTLELVVGRLFAEIDAGADTPFEFVTANGRASCTSGSFTAVVTLSRLRIACATGEVRVAGEGGGLVLHPGESANLFEGKASGPVRTVASGLQLHWLGMLRDYDGRRLVPRQMALVAVAPEAPLLPPNVEVEAIHLRFFMRGALAVVQATLDLHNAGDAPWQGNLSLRDAVLPPPLAALDAEEVSLPAGARAEARLVALCVLRNRSTRYGVGVSPAIWAANVGPVSVEVDAAADGGIREFLAPTLRPSERRPRAVVFQQTYTDDAAPRPVVLEMLLGKEGADAFELPDAAGPLRVSALRGDAEEEPWLSRDKKVFLAFDATGDFGRGGRVAAHEALEGLIGSLPPGATTALIAYDGRVKFDPDRLMLHLPVRAESMLDRLWQLEPPEGEAGQAAGFLAAALLPVSGVEAESFTVFVTGRNDPGDLEACRQVLAQGRTRLAVLQVGAAEPAPAYTALCAGTGGVAIAVPASMAPQLGVIDFLANLPQPAVLEVRPAAGGGQGPRVLRGPGDFANQALVLLSPEGAGGEVEAVCGEQRLTMSLPASGASVPGLSGAEAARLSDAVGELPGD